MPQLFDGDPEMRIVALEQKVLELQKALEGVAVTLAKLLGAPAAPFTPTDRLWASGTAFLIRRGMNERQARQIIGKWLKSYEPEAVLEAFRSAQAANTGDPVSYITQTLGASQRRAGVEAAWYSVCTLGGHPDRAAAAASTDVNAAVAALGGWRRIGLATSFEMNTLRKQFALVYKESP